MVGGQSNIVTDDKYNVARICVIEYESGTTPLVGFNLGAILDPRNGAYKGLIKVLHDQVYLLPSPGEDSTGYLPALREVTIDVPLNLDVSYVSASGGAVNLSSHAVMIGVVTDSAAPPSPGFINGTATLTFEDM